MSEHPGNKMQHKNGQLSNKEMHELDLLTILARQKNKIGKQRGIDLKVIDV
jgi:hypothetical protein